MKRTPRSGRARGTRKVPIDHGRIIDGFGEMIGYTHYEDRVLPCGGCGVLFTFTARDQKYVHEIRGVPIKFADRGAAYCSECVRARAAQNRARRAERDAQRLHENALRFARETPDDPLALLAAAATRLRRLGPRPTRGGANEVVHPARRARKIDPACLEALLWEARGLVACGHPRAAVRALDTLAGRLGETGDRRLLAEARALRDEIEGER